MRELDCTHRPPHTAVASFLVCVILVAGLNFGACSNRAPVSASATRSAPPADGDEPSVDESAVNDSSETWVDETLGRLTTDQKLGQMIYARAWGRFQNFETKQVQELIEAAREERIGGVIVFAGEPFETAALLNRLQEVAPLPLMVGADYEWGPAMRVEGASRFPIAMAMGSAATIEDMEFQAEVTAREAKAMGVHLILAPVMDLNTDPENSVINGRSFGEDPERAATLSEAFIARLQRRGVLATGKHFPGHGATHVDSHSRLPVITLSADRLRRVEMLPFRRSIDAGIAAIMPGHIALPSLEDETYEGGPRPATFSAPILEGILRRELGFEGLIVSDAMDMGSARENLWDGAAAIRAVQAGVDMLIVPPDPNVTLQSLRRAVERGELSIARIDQAVRRILRAKARLGLDRHRTVDLDDLPRRLSSPGVSERIESLTEKTLTLVDDQHHLVPLKAAGGSLALIEFVPSNDPVLRPNTLRRELSARTTLADHLRFPLDSGAVSPERLERLRRVDTVVVVSYSRARGSTLPRPLVELAEALDGGGTRLIFASLGDPYVLNEVSSFAKALLTTYDGPPAAQRALAKGLFGEIPIRGRLPVTLSPSFPIGHREERTPKAMQLTSAPPESVDMSTEGIEAAARIVEQAIEDGAAPGAVFLVARRGRVVLHRAVGNMSFDADAAPMQRDTIFDLASLTKVFVTTTATMKLHEQGRLDLDRPVHAYLPEFRGEDKDRVTVRDLLVHSGGLLWWTELYKMHEGKSPEQAKQGYLEHIYQLPLDYPPRSKMIYTDLGILLLGEILSRVSGQSLRELAQEMLIRPLSMQETGYLPDPALLPRIAPTERDEWRGRIVHGEVHDENAYGLGGVAPHAGLFATASDMARFAQMMLNEGTFDGVRLLKPETIRLFTRRANVVKQSSRALGWDTPSDPSSSGKYFSASSYGHTGFTGTSMWLDPERELFAILLTNRVHPTRENRKIYDTRPAFHDAVMQSITDERVAPRQ